MPEIIDNYKILELIHHGAMGSIYKAENLRSSRIVAIKIPCDELSMDSVSFDAYRMEKEIGKRLDDPRFIKLYEAGYKKHYIIMEYVEGKELRSIFHGIPISFDSIQEIFIDICKAVEFFHSKGIVHHDLKPENIMLPKEGGIKIIDFGLAGIIGEMDSITEKYTAPKGTPEFISPEQFLGIRCDHRSDIYSVGTMLYKALVGKLPFSGKGTALTKKKLSDEPMPPKALIPDFSPHLQEIILKALEPNPRNRYQKIEELCNDLQEPLNVPLTERAYRTKSSALKNGGLNIKDFTDLKDRAPAVKKYRILAIFFDRKPQWHVLSEIASIARERDALVNIILITPEIMDIEYKQGAIESMISSLKSEILFDNEWVLDFFKGNWIEATIEVHVREPLSAISEIINRNKTDLIITSERERGKLSKAIFRSISAKIVDITDCSVLVIR